MSVLSCWFDRPDAGSDRWIVLATVRRSEGRSGSRMSGSGQRRRAAGTPEDRLWLYDVPFTTLSDSDFARACTAASEAR
jgi:hypothetical protein